MAQNINRFQIMGHGESFSQIILSWRPTLALYFTPAPATLHRGQTLEHAQRRKFWSRARQFPAQNFEGKPLQQSEIVTLIVICERKQKQVKGEVQTFQTQSSVYFQHSVDLPFFGRLPKKLDVFKTWCNDEVCRRSLFLFDV